MKTLSGVFIAMILFTAAARSQDAADERSGARCRSERSAYASPIRSSQSENEPAFRGRPIPMALLSSPAALLRTRWMPCLLLIQKLPRCLPESRRRRC